MNSLQFKKNELKRLSAIIGCKPYEIEYITEHIDDYYTEWLEEKINKSTGTVKKYKDGTPKMRVIRPSLRRLKEIQSSIKKRILSEIQLPDNIHGGVKGKSNITNAKPHQGKKFKFTTDLKDFYPSVKSTKVYNSFLLLGFSNHIAHWLTKLTTWRYELPQGTPTSTHVSNIAFLETDRKLIAFSKQHNLTYTRYIDDLTFSSQQDFKSMLGDILEIIKSDDFNINYRKTIYSVGPTSVTGIDVFNNFIDAPLKIKIKVKEEALLNKDSRPYLQYQERIRATNKNRTP